MALACFAGVSLSAQNYQSAFSNVQFDKAKPPATGFGSVQVEHPAGKLNLNQPLGPGIGSSRLRFVPTFHMLFAPNWKMAPCQVPGVVAAGGATYSDPIPMGSGNFDFGLGSLTLDVMNLGKVNSRSNVVYPGGGGESIRALAPTGVDTDKIIQSFGFSGDTRIATGPVKFDKRDGVTPISAVMPLIQQGVDGGLVLGLASTSDPELKVWGGATSYWIDPANFRLMALYWPDNSSGPLTPGYLASGLHDGMVSGEAAPLQMPQRVLVVKGDLAYEYQLAYYPGYTDPTRKEVGPTPRYGIISIRSRSGEQIRFNYLPASGVIVEAHYFRDNGATDTGLGVRYAVSGNNLAIRVSYIGIDHSAYVIQSQSDPMLDASQITSPYSSGMVAGYSGNALGWLMAEGNSLEGSFVPTSILQEFTNYRMDFHYTNLPFQIALQGQGVTNAALVAPTPVLTSVTTPTRTQSFEWASLACRLNGDSASSTVMPWQGYVPGTPQMNIGVAKVTETAGPQSRQVTYQRQVPTPSFYVSSSAGMVNWTCISPDWATTAFWDAETLPDGSVNVRFYAQPLPAGRIGGPNDPLDDQLQVLAFLKHMAAGERHYLPGQNWQADLTTPPETSIAYRVTTLSGWSAKSLLNPDGLVTNSSSVYPTISRTYTRETPGGPYLMTESSQENFDATTGQWLTTRTKTYSGTTLVREETQSRTFDLRRDLWMPARVKSTSTSLLSDTAGGMITGVTFPAVPAPSTSTEYEDLTDPTMLFGRPKASVLGDTGLQTRVAMTYKGSTGLAGQQLATVTLSSPQSLTFTGQVGVSAYGYDTYGFMNSISVMGAPAAVTEDHDSAGHPVAQTDMNALKNTMQWDSAGRLKSITPPNGEVGTTYTYDADFLGVVMTRGLQSVHYRYNGFGQVVKEDRSTPTLTSMKVFGYDTMGRSTWQSAWLGTAVSDDVWAQTWGPGYVAKVPAWTEYVFKYNKCTQWGDDGNGNMVCIQSTPVYQQVQHPEVPAKWQGLTGHVYDTRGREITTISPNGEVTKTAYDLLSKTITHGFTWVNDTIVTPTLAPVSTSFLSDPVGRLVRVVDAKNQVTDYRYDVGNRIAQVSQYPTSTGTGLAAVGTGTPQVRTWEYNALGWMTALNQPESGRTEYSNFTVTGKPQTTVYGAGSASPRTLTTTYDVLGRVKAVTSSDGSVNQSFKFGEEEAGHGLANGKLVRATAGSVVRVLDYTGLNGRLSALTRSVDGINWTQGFIYDATYGTLTSRTYPDGKVQTVGYDYTRGLPTATGFTGATNLSTMGYDPIHWGLNQLSFGNGATSGFTYDADQTRLKTMSHAVPGAPGKAWTYTYDTRGNLANDSEDYYSYDELGRLTMALVWDPFTGTGQGLQQAFAYDAFGNRQSLTSQVVSNWTTKSTLPSSLTVAALSTSDKRDLRTYAMAPAELSVMSSTNRLPATVGGVATGAAHDAQGNLTGLYRVPGQSGTQLLMSYDTLGRVSSLSDSANATSQAYLHDDEGLRIKITDSKTNKTTYNVYNESRQLIASYEKVGTGALTWKKDIVYVGTKEVAEIDSANKTWVTFVDHLGSPRLIWDGTATTTVDGTHLIQQKFMPFGEALASPTVMASFAKGFTNHERTDDSGLIYMQARFYAPWFGRFLSPDPARDQHFEDTQTWNIYSYCGNDPTMRTDPTGMVTIDLDALAKAASNAASKAGKAISDGASKAWNWAFGKKPETQSGGGGNKTALIKAQDAARNNPKLQREDSGVTHCNAATLAVVKAVGGPTAPLTDTKGNLVNANQQAKQLAGSSQYKEVAPQAAITTANNGGLAIVAWSNPGGHGHLATVRPEGVTGDHPVGGKGPLLNDIGRFDTVHRESQAFPKSSINNHELHYYVPTR
jgi:RHS repeat-associated protein